MEPQGDPNWAPAAVKNTSAASLYLQLFLFICCTETQLLIIIVVIIGFYLNAMQNYILKLLVETVLYHLT